MPQKLIIDADPGIGDALAIAVALSDPDLDVIALTGVGGCVSPLQSGRNLQAIVEVLDPPKWPRIGVGYTGPELPGVDEKDLDVAVHNGLLTVSGSRQAEERKEGESYALYERQFGSFSRSFALPDMADGDRIDASLKNGILMLTIPKKAEAKPRKIEIKK